MNSKTPKEIHHKFDRAEFFHLPKERAGLYVDGDIVCNLQGGLASFSRQVAPDKSERFAEINYPFNLGAKADIQQVVGWVRIAGCVPTETYQQWLLSQSDEKFTVEHIGRLMLEIAHDAVEIPELAVYVRVSDFYGLHIQGVQMNALARLHPVHHLAIKTLISRAYKIKSKYRIKTDPRAASIKIQRASARESLALRQDIHQLLTTAEEQLFNTNMRKARTLLFTAKRFAKPAWSQSSTEARDMLRTLASFDSTEKLH